jgi:putative alpha-1,2-mannosidase
MGSLAVLMKLGLFQLKTGADEQAMYQIGSPIFDKVTIHLNNEYYPGKEVVIETSNATPDTPVVNTILWNGKEFESFEINHQTLVGGGKLELQMSGLK